MKIKYTYFKKDDKYQCMCTLSIRNKQIISTAEAKTLDEAKNKSKSKALLKIKISDK